MKRYQIKNVSDIPLEGTHDLPNSRQTLASTDDLVADNFDALTKGPENSEFYFVRIKV